MIGSHEIKSNKKSKHNLKLILAAAMDRSIDEAVDAKLHESEQRIVEKVVSILLKRNQPEPADIPADRPEDYEGISEDLIRIDREHPLYKSGR